MIREGIHYYTSGEEGCRQPPFGARACESGFSLTFNAFAFLQVRDALPEPARKAWAEGLRWYAQYNVTSPPGGPENMQLSVPVGIYYAGLALGDDALKQKAAANSTTAQGSRSSSAGGANFGVLKDLEKLDSLE